MRFDWQRFVPVALVLSVSVGVMPASAQIYDPYMDFDAPKTSSSPQMSASVGAPVSQPTRTPSAAVMEKPYLPSKSIYSGAESSNIPPAPTVYGTAPDPYSGMINHSGRVYMGGNAKSASLQPDLSQVAPYAGATSAYPEAYLQVTQTVEPLAGSLKNKYQALRITVRNTQPRPLELLSGQVLNGIDSAVAARESAAASQSARSARSMFSSGLGYIPYFGNGASAINAAASYGDARDIEDEQNNAASKTKVLPQGVISPNGRLSIVTLVPINQRAVVRMTFRDLKTNETYTVTPSY